MSAAVLLVRHAHTAVLGLRLTGRLPGVALTMTGRAQAQRLAARLREAPLAAIYSSPMERALETARPLAEARGLAIVECPNLTEIDFGEWTGQTFEVLDRLPGWRRFNAERGSAEVPGGETALDVQRRAVEAVQAIAARHEGETVVAVTHGDIIRSVLLHYAGKPLDRIADFEISPASITALSITPALTRILYINDRDSG